MVKQKLSWKEIKEGKAIATFKNTNTLILKFLSEGSVSTVVIENKDGTSKEREQVHFEVFDYVDNKEKDFNIVSTRLIEALSNYDDITPLLNTYVKIDKLGQGFDTNYLVSEFKPPKASQVK